MRSSISTCWAEKTKPQSGRVFTSGFGQIGTAPAFAANFLRHRTDHLTCLHAAGQIFRDAHDQRYVAVRRRAEHHNAGANLVAQLIDQRAQLRAFQIIHAMRENLHAFHIFDLIADVGRAR
jgi:hypothetical protein